MSETRTALRLACDPHWECWCESRCDAHIDYTEYWQHYFGWKAGADD